MTVSQILPELDVSRETYERLECYVALLKKWSPKINLVSKSTLDGVWKRHIGDSAQVLPLLPEGMKRIVDLGSGAGFPGLVLAVLALERKVPFEVTLVESDGRKATFLREVIRETGAAAQVRVERAEALDMTADVVTARAFMPLAMMLPVAQPLIGKEGVALLHKGARYESELTDAVKNWHMETEIHKSRIDPASVILRISELERRQDGV